MLGTNMSDILLGIVLAMLSLELLVAVRASDVEFEVSGCELKEPVYDHVFNLSALHSDFGHKINNGQGDTIEFNVCGGLSRRCGEDSNVAACLRKKDGKAYTLGKTGKLHYTNGRMFFKFADGSKCTADKNYTLYVTLNCDYTLDVEPFNVVSTDDPECTYYISWETMYACLPLPSHLQSNVCSTVDEKTGHKFDLMPLSDWNYRVSDRKGSNFIINVCKPVLYGQNSMCPSDSGVCYVDDNATDIKQKYINYGTAQSNPIFQNGQLIMNFNSSVKCNDKENISSIIYFLCYREAQREKPEFIQKNGCKYEFSWLTALACNDVKPCTALSPTTGKEYDFNSIAGVYNVSQGDKHYRVAICKDVGSPCNEKDGACEIINNKPTSLGKSNLEIRLNDTGSPYAIYKSGSECGNSESWTTKMEFICSTNSSDQGPKIIENSKCQFIIHFGTNLACKEQILCKVSDSERTIDLTPLINSAENYVAAVNETALQADNSNSVKYYLNVCRPLVSQYGLSCPGGSAACRAVVKDSGTPEQEQSLGYPTSSLTISNANIQLKYLYGDKCPADESEKMSARINFKCALDAGKGRPILQSVIKNCHYQFDWFTSVICPPEKCNFFADTCTVTNPRTSKSFNFRNANFANNGTIKIAAKPKPFDVNICEPNRTVSADYSESAVKMFFVANGPCGINGLVNIQLRFVCATNSNISTLHDNQACNIILTRETSEICEFLGLPIPNVLPSTTTTSATPSTLKPTTVAPTKPTTTASTSQTTPATNGLHPSESKSKMVTTAAAIITVCMAALVILSIVCLRDPNRRMAVKSFFRRNSPSVLYRRINTDEEANLLLSNSQPMTDSDDDLIL